MDGWSEFTAWVAAFFSGPWAIPLKVVLVLVVAILVRSVTLLVIRRVVSRLVGGVKRQHNVDDTQLIDSPMAAARLVQRSRALGGILSGAVTVAVAITALVLIISIVAPGATGAFALMTAALGAALGFGAQNLIRDVLAGVFLVAEDQFGVGDAVDLGPASGVVEKVDIRVTVVRDVNGTLWYVRNGEITRVGNLSQSWSRVIIDVAVPYDADVEIVQQHLLKTALDMADIPKWKPLILEPPQVWGIESISAEAVVLRVVAKTRAGSNDDVARELRGRLKRALDELGIRIPSLNTTVLSGSDGVSSVRGARPPKTAPTQVPSSKHDEKLSS
jgi:small conductance mechanosensitive channel